MPRLCQMDSLPNEIITYIVEHCDAQSLLQLISAWRRLWKMITAEFVTQGYHVKPQGFRVCRIDILRKGLTVTLWIHNFHISGTAVVFCWEYNNVTEWRSFGGKLCVSYIRALNCRCEHYNRLEWNC